jgi:Thioredoxin
MNEPDFLYAPDNTYRIVLHYFHWCNTCKNIVPHYITLANKLLQLLQERNHNNVTMNIYAISCSPNMVLCKDQKIRSFPRIRLFPPSDTMGLEYGAL